ncbi:WAT1-related protein At1g68170-like [Pistacia vera]|uniref:WAT1-related protein At1g68170-like n=1 Tax=Pistacia vera TaxID=55513 RepID=UPI0012639DE3|nr:WAT1-related protein At1g68170-like [Pistacia vera]
MVKKYPCKYSSTALMCTAAAIQATIYALFTETDPSKWKLGWNIRLLSAVYKGAVATGLMVVVMAWCVRIKGPLFVSIFNPLSLVFVALIGSLILNEKLHMGSIIGSVFIIIGLYAVLWGKGREMKKKTDQRALDLEFKSCSSGV